MNILLHFLNPEILKLYNVDINNINQVQRTRIDSLTKMSFLLSLANINSKTNFLPESKLIIPVSYIGEINWISLYFKNIAPLINDGYLCYSSYGNDIGERIEMKKKEYRDKPSMAHGYSDFDFESLEKLIFLPKTQYSATKMISINWKSDIENESISWKKIFDREENKTRNIQRELINVADIINDDGKAFIFDFVKPLLPVELNNNEKYLLSSKLSIWYLYTFLYEYPNCRIIIDTPLGLLNCGEHFDEERVISYSKVYDRLCILGIEELLKLSYRKLINYSSSHELKQIITHIISERSLDWKPKKQYKRLHDRILEAYNFLHKSVSNTIGGNNFMQDGKHYTNSQSKKAKIFISHSTKDKNFVLKLVELLEAIGLKKGDIFCSSVPEYGVPLGEDIYEYIRNTLADFNLHVLFVLSEDYYNSKICLNEMGAAWVLRYKYTSFLTKGFSFKMISGSINPNQISIALDDNTDILNARLNELKDYIIKDFELDNLDNTTWERKRNNFTAAVN